MNRRARALLILPLFACCLLALILLYQAQSRRAPALNRVAAWMPTSWDGARARASWEANRAAIDELSPVWYRVDADGSGTISPYAGARDETLVAEAHAHGALVIPLINNDYPATGFDPGPVSAIIHDPARRAAHIEVLVDEVVTYGYDGIDVDYEALNGTADREAFSVFIEELAAALHAHDKLLSIAVHAKTGAPGGWDGPRAQDWARLGAAVDRFRVMTYAYHWSGSEPGPIAPQWWMEDVLAFATSVVSPNKVYVGIHFYGHDWSAGGGRSVVWEDVQALSAAHGALARWQAQDPLGRPVAEPWLAYTDAQGHTHEVWYANRTSVVARLALVREYGLGGIAVWRLGGEDPATWLAIATAMRPVVGGTGTPAP
jgi:spore germination protein YaaH